MKYKMVMIFTLFFCTSSHASQWTYLAHSPSGNKSYAMINTPSETFPVIWFKISTAKDITQEISKVVIDCKLKRYAFRSIDRYDYNGTVILNEHYSWLHWSEIIPDSMADFEYKFSCEKK